MKIKWIKERIGFDVKDFKKMSEDEAWELVKNFYIRIGVETWLNWSYLFNWLATNNMWQYILARYIL